MSVKALIYRHLLARVPRAVRDPLARSTLLRPVRDWFFRPGGTPSLHRVPVRFEGFEFTFAAPFQSAHVAQTRGIENRICRFLVDHSPRGGTCIDVGANYGYVSLVMARAVGPTGRVVSIEASAHVYEGLSSNIAANGMQAMTTAIHGFAGRREDAGSSPPAVTVDAIVRANALSHVDVIKIDVDGPELDVLHGARESLQRFRPAIVVELTRDHEVIYDFLVDAGYACVDMDGLEVRRGAWPENLFATHGRLPTIRTSSKR